MTRSRLRCDNRNKRLDGVEIWSSETVEHQLPLGEFLTLARSFADDLLDQMEDRTRRVEAGWSRAGVRLELLKPLDVVVSVKAAVLDVHRWTIAQMAEHLGMDGAQVFRAARSAATAGLLVADPAANRAGEPMSVPAGARIKSRCWERSQASVSPSQRSRRVDW